MTVIAHLLEWVLTTGPKLAKFFASPLGGPFGVIVPVVSGLQALKGWISGKVTFTNIPESASPAEDVKRERVRRRLARLWIMQVVIAVLSLVLILRLYVFDEIPKRGTPPVTTPTLVQSALLVALLILTLLAILIGLARLKVASTPAD